MGGVPSAGSGAGPGVPASRDPNAPSRPGIVWYTLATLLAAILLYFSLRGVDWRRVWEIISHARAPYLLAACLSALTALLLRSLRWRVVLNADDRFAVGTVFMALSAGYLGNNFLPARAGEVVRSVMISRASCLSKTYVLTTALAERLMDVIALVLFGSLVLLGLDSAPRWIGDVSRALAVAAGAGAIAMLVLPRVESPVCRAMLRLPLPAAWRGRLAALAAQGFLGIRAFHDAGRFCTFVALTVLIWSVDALGIIVGGRAVHLEISFPVAVLLLSGLGLGSALPSTPGYVGVYQFVAVSVLVPFGFRRDDALAYILVAQALSYVVITACGSVGLAKYRALNARRLTART